MLKSFPVQRIEAQNEGRDIKDLLIECLEGHRGTGKVLTSYIAIHFRVSEGTIRNWCRDLEIDLAQYRNEVPTGVPE